MPDNAKKLEVAQRRKFVLEKRREGHRVREIAQMAYDEFGEERLPNSWDEKGRYVSKDLHRALKQAREDVEEIAKNYRELHINRLENLLAELWPYAQEHEKEVYDEEAGETFTVTEPPDARIVDRVLAIMDKLAKFHHVQDAPDRPSNPGSNETNFFLQVNQSLQSDE